MRRVNYVLAIVTMLVLPVMPAIAQSIFVSNDEWSTDSYYLGLVDDKQFAKNVAAWLTEGSTGPKKILILSNAGRLNNSTFAGYLTSLGYSVTTTTAVPVTFPTPAQYQAIYVAGECKYTPLVFATAVPCSAGFAALDASLVTYVNGGGNVFLAGGIVCNEGKAWNAFLNAFGLNLDSTCNGIYTTKVDVSPFQTQVLYGPQLFNNVNRVYIDGGENVSSPGANPSVEIFTDANGNPLYGAWRPGGCSGSGNELYSDGTANGTINAYRIGFGFTSSNSFGVPPSGYSVNGFCLYVWVTPGDILESVEASVTSQPSGGTTYFDAIANMTCSLYCTAGQPVNGGSCGQGIENVYSCTASVNPFNLAGGTYWLNLHNASSVLGAPVYWDQNNARLCAGIGCPSQAFENSTAVPAEAFDILKQ